MVLPFNLILSLLRVSFISGKATAGSFSDPALKRFGILWLKCDSNSLSSWPNERIKDDEVDSPSSVDDGCSGLLKMEGDAELPFFDRTVTGT